ncbi:hypothetical protein ACFRCG_06370 [Embleya sp. NPDC056575]|uniref:hypothetical protein n=1 Tax=unclassified Embleya TaxID=2699296 RepID=UPI0036C8FDF9
MTVLGDTVRERIAEKSESKPAPHAGKRKPKRRAFAKPPRAHTTKPNASRASCSKATTPIADLGPQQGTGPTRPTTA